MVLLVITMTELKILKDLKHKGIVDNLNNERMATFISIEELKAEVIKIFNESLTIEEFGKKMVRFFEIQEEI